jgi:nucleoside 2-deoxyribosyltransferase
MDYKAYLAGPITACSYEGCNDWREYASKILAYMNIEGLSPLRGKDYLLAETRLMDTYDEHVLSQGRGIMTRDYFDCMRADILIVNFLGAERASIGTAMEVAWAYTKHTPVIAIMEEKGNIHDHSMIREAIGYRVKTLEEAIEIADIVLNGKPRYKAVMDWVKNGNTKLPPKG